MTKARSSEPKVYETISSDPLNTAQLDLEYGDNFEPEEMFEENDMDGEGRRKARLEAQEVEDAKEKEENDLDKNGSANGNEINDDM